ncbi:MAG TPA: fumarylacetoacetate hydrolase family protein, partial [Candidatus Thermoplasmatota archaeon]|nr:fumarylacetoacetate hydrolase family protein [Candidatus Thermoplasmatota archaeon]
MRLASIVTGAGLDVAVQFPRKPPFLLSEMRRAGVGRRQWGPTLLHLIAKEEVDDLRPYAEAFQPNATPLRPEDLVFTTPFPHPGKIWGIGLNFREHAADLGAAAPEEPGSWMRPASTLAEPSGPIRLPPGIGRITGEG